MNARYHATDLLADACTTATDSVPMTWWQALITVLVIFGLAVGVMWLVVRWSSW